MAPVFLMKTSIYIDGFNLYYRALKNNGGGYRWLDLRALSEKLMPNDQIAEIHYYTARVSSRTNPTAPRDQQIYINALETIPNLFIHYGSFFVNSTYAYLYQPVQFRPNCTTQPIPTPKYAKILKTEEKGSDVNLGVHLVRDACMRKYEKAVVITNDTDLAEPVRIVTQELQLPVVLATPVAIPANVLRSSASSLKHIKKTHIIKSQFPNSFIHDGKTITKPADW